MDLSGDSDLRPSHEGAEPREEFAEAVDSSYGGSPEESDDEDVEGIRAGNGSS